MDCASVWGFFLRFGAVFLILGCFFPDLLPLSGVDRGVCLIFYSFVYDDGRFDFGVGLCG